MTEFWNHVDRKKIKGLHSFYKPSGDGNPALRIYSLDPRVKELLENPAPYPDDEIPTEHCCPTCGSIISLESEEE